MLPYLDLPGFLARVTALQPTDVQVLEGMRPGFTAQRIASRSSYINARLRKRYGNAPNIGSYIPLGQNPPLLVAADTTPPQVQLVGRPLIGSIAVTITIMTLGALGTAQFTWTAPATVTTAQGPFATAALVPLTGTGMSATFAPGTYGGDNVYAAAPPVPEAVLGWLVSLVSVDLFLARGVNPQDPGFLEAKDELTRSLEELKEASDSKDGLFDLPVTEDEDSAITTGGPQAYSETSPYVWADFQRQDGMSDDASALASTEDP